MEVRIKKLHPKAVVPAYATEGSAGLDLTAVSRGFDEHGNIVYGFGLAFEIPKGYAGFVFPRSSVSRYGLDLTNAVGVVDADYRGEVTAKFKPQLGFDKEDGVGYREKLYNVGDRAAQMVIMPVPRIELVEAEELSETERGEGGYGSTGK